MADIDVIVSSFKVNLGAKEKLAEKRYDFYADEDVNEFAKHVNNTVFELCKDSDEVLVYYICRSRLKTHDRLIQSSAIRYLGDKSIIEQRIISDMKGLMNPDKVD